MVCLWLICATVELIVGIYYRRREKKQLEEEPVISPEKQALVDIFLAEEVLQVAYEMHEQTEPLRAYIAILEGEELETSHQIISF